MSAKKKERVAQMLPVAVYGTLMRGMSNHHHFGKMEKQGTLNIEMAAGLERVEVGRVRGFKMYDLGYYPMAVPAPEDTDLIRCELMFIKPNAYSEVLAKLDKLEGYQEGRKDNFYTRVVVPVHYTDMELLDNGVIKEVKKQQLAWMYVGMTNDSLKVRSSSAIIPAGDWAAHVKLKGN